MNIDYVIVQAGGKGTRLKHLTKNKPKAIVPVENLPMLFHLFRKFPDKKFIIIADYKKEVMHCYLEAFADVKYQVVEAEGQGTCSGIKKALSLIPEKKPFMLIWSDLILFDGLKLPKGNENFIGISQTFPCRWKYENGDFLEEPSKAHGVAGLFIFNNKKQLARIPKTGEFVRWLSTQNIGFETIGLAGTREFGTLEEYEKLAAAKTRPFNKMKIEGDIVIKESIDEQGNQLAKRETSWYKYAMDNEVTAIPKIFEYEPLKMERITGENIYDIKADEKILERVVDALKELHKVKIIETDTFSMKAAYYTKTMERLDKIRNLVPFANRPLIKINGRDCRNIFFNRREFEKLTEGIESKNFNFIHGDCTFSNLMLRQDKTPVFIDPRGYFGHTELFGDADYDWAKLYYSLVGNYDQFNLKEFSLEIGEDSVVLVIKSNGWEHLADIYFKMAETDKEKVKLIHAIIWLSLTTYAWQDYDSVCGAFYNGLYYLEECWQ